MESILIFQKIIFFIVVFIFPFDFALMLHG